MSNVFEEPLGSAALSHGCREIEGEPKPGLEETVDEAIYKVLVAQRREINRRNLPDLEE